MNEQSPNQEPKMGGLMQDGKEREAQEANFLHQLYDTFRTVRLNEIYYFNLVIRTRKQAMILDLTTMIGASAVVLLAALSLNLASSYDIVIKQLLIILSSVVAMLSATRPVLALPEKQEKFVSQYRSYAQLRLSLERIVERIRMTHLVETSDKDEFSKLLNDMRSISAVDHSDASPKLVKEMQNQVLNEYPVEKFWWGRDAEPSKTGDVKQVG